MNPANVQAVKLTLTLPKNGFDPNPALAYRLAINWRL